MHVSRISCHKRVTAVGDSSWKCLRFNRYQHFNTSPTKSGLIRFTPFDLLIKITDAGRCWLRPFDIQHEICMIRLHHVPRASSYVANRFNSCVARRHYSEITMVTPTSLLHILWSVFPLFAIKCKNWRACFDCPLMIAVFLVLFNFLLANFDDSIAMCRHHSLLDFFVTLFFSFSENAKSDESSLPPLLVGRSKDTVCCVVR